MRKHEGSSNVEMGEDLGNEGGEREGETASIVAGNPRVIWDHPGSRGVSMCVYAHVCPGAGGRQAGTEKHLLWTPGLA